VTGSAISMNEFIVEMKTRYLKPSYLAKVLGSPITFEIAPNLIGNLSERDEGQIIPKL
jgi:hypothetical protein